ncbi:MAG: hypothetical protein U0792_07825 [Gemmataceae bacterium]
MTDHIVVFDGTARLIGRYLACVAVKDASPFNIYGDVLTDELIGVDLAREPVSPVADALNSPTSRFSLPLV